MPETSKHACDTLELDKRGLTDMLNGATLLGSGGGGPYEIGEQVIEKILATGKTPNVVDAQDMPDDAWAVIAAGVGSPNAAGGFDPSVASDAVRAMGEAMGVTFEYIMAAEIGAGNTFMPLFVADDMDIAALNVAGSSRAVPAITMSTFAADSVPVNELMVANHDQKVGISVKWAKNASGPMRAVISDPSFGQIAGLAIWPMQGKTVKKSAIRGTYNMAQELGAALRKGIKDGDPVAAVCDHLGGKVLARGKLLSHTESTSGGFDMGSVMVEIPASGSDAATELIILNKNENLIAWRSDKNTPLTIAPDLISYMLPDGTVFSNVQIPAHIGKEIVVIASPAGPNMRKPGIVDAFKEVLSAMGYPGPATELGNL